MNPVDRELPYSIMREAVEIAWEDCCFFWAIGMIFFLIWAAPLGQPAGGASHLSPQAVSALPGAHQAQGSGR